MMLRRTKLERADDLGLPPRTIVVRRDFFSPAEKELYSSLFSNARRQFSTYIDAGTVLNSQSHVSGPVGPLTDDIRLLQYLLPHHTEYVTF